jgi:hypothetical protein
MERVGVEQYIPLPLAAELLAMMLLVMVAKRPSA